MKTSLGIWAFGPMITRFVPTGYQPEHSYEPEPVAEKVHRAVEGLGDLIDGYEFHYPERALAREPRRGARRRSARITTSTASPAACTSIHASAAAGSSTRTRSSAARRAGSSARRPSSPARSAPT